VRIIDLHPHQRFQFAKNFMEQIVSFRSSTCWLLAYGILIIIVKCFFPMLANKQRRKGPDFRKTSKR
jgi:hypothetical protein